MVIHDATPSGPTRSYVSSEDIAQRRRYRDRPPSWQGRPRYVRTGTRNESDFRNTSATPRTTNALFQQTLPCSRDTAIKQTKQGVARAEPSNTAALPRQAIKGTFHLRLAPQPLLKRKPSPFSTCEERTVATSDITCLKESGRVPCARL